MKAKERQFNDFSIKNNTKEISQSHKLADNLDVAANYDKFAVHGNKTSFKVKCLNENELKSYKAKYQGEIIDIYFTYGSQRKTISWKIYENPDVTNYDEREISTSFTVFNETFYFTIKQAAQPHYTQKTFSGSTGVILSPLEFDGSTYSGTAYEKKMYILSADNYEGMTKNIVEKDVSGYTVSADFDANTSYKDKLVSIVFDSQATDCEDVSHSVQLTQKGNPNAPYEFIESSATVTWEVLSASDYSFIEQSGATLNKVVVAISCDVNVRYTEDDTVVKKHFGTTKRLAKITILANTSTDVITSSITQDIEQTFSGSGEFNSGKTFTISVSPSLTYYQAGSSAPNWEEDETVYKTTKVEPYKWNDNYQPLASGETLSVTFRESYTKTITNSGKEHSSDEVRYIPKEWVIEANSTYQPLTVQKRFELDLIDGTKTTITLTLTQKGKEKEPTIDETPCYVYYASLGGSFNYALSSENENKTELYAEALDKLMSFSNKNEVNLIEVTIPLYTFSSEDYLKRFILAMPSNNSYYTNALIEGLTDDENYEYEDFVYSKKNVRYNEQDYDVFICFVAWDANNNVRLNKIFK